MTFLLSLQDSHTLLVDGVQRAAAGDAADGVVLIDTEAGTIVASGAVPGSVVGPPTAAWIAPDATWAIVTAATRAQGGALVPDDCVSVLSLPRRAGGEIVTMQTIPAGSGATTVRATESHALVANRQAGTVSIYLIRGQTLDFLQTVDLGAGSGPSGIGIHPDETVLVSCDGANRVVRLRADGLGFVVGADLHGPWNKPYQIDVAADGTVAVANMGDASVVMLRGEALTRAKVPPLPEGIRFSPDGKFLAAGCQRGSTLAATAPGYTKGGAVVVLEVPSGRELARGEIGGWSQGVAWSADGGKLFVQDMIERRLSVFAWDGAVLSALPPIPMPGGPAAFATPW